MKKYKVSVSLKIEKLKKKKKKHWKKMYGIEQKCFSASHIIYQGLQKIKPVLTS